MATTAATTAPATVQSTTQPEVTSSLQSTTSLTLPPVTPTETPARVATTRSDPVTSGYSIGNVTAALTRATGPPPVTVGLGALNLNDGDEIAAGGAVATTAPAATTVPMGRTESMEWFNRTYNRPASSAPFAFGVQPGTNLGVSAPSGSSTGPVRRPRQKFTLKPINRPESSVVGSGMSKRLSIRDLASIDYKPQAGSVASEEKISQIGLEFTKVGISADQLTEVGVFIARHCADVGSSNQSRLIGTFPGSDVELEELATIIKSTAGCTLRQFCAYYAKMVWNLMLETKTPPAIWSSKGYREENKYAAFDFFYGVDSSAALEPVDGIIRKPTNSERVANETMKEAMSFRAAARDGTQSTNIGEITGGKAGPKPRLTIKQ
uniref:Capsid protein n=1 Tax=Peach chlorotic mottle virus TaxID=471498 RepID=A0A3S7EC29_9VIRU|nr:coat protein [Peach chlorotic mottle virus]